MGMNEKLLKKINPLKFFLASNSVLALLSSFASVLFPEDIQPDIRITMIFFVLSSICLVGLWYIILNIQEWKTKKKIDKNRYKAIKDMFCELDIPFSEYRNFFSKTYNESLISAARIWIEHKILLPQLPGTKVEKIIDQLLPKNVKHKSPFVAPVIEIDNCFIIVDEAKKIRIYLKQVQKAAELIQKYEADIIPDNSTSFLCKIRIKHSYLSPRFLIHGMMAAFDEEWEPVVNRYGIDVAQRKSGRNGDFESFRVFQFNCWVIWGPSIPLCTCKDWSSRRNYTLQLGFGDENNSIDFLYTDDGETLGIDKDIINEFCTTPAVAVDVTGTLHDAEHLCKNDNTCTLGNCQKNVLCDPIFDENDIANKHHSAPVRLVFKLKDRSSLKNSLLPTQKNYYSAYIWIMFSIPQTPLLPGARIENANREAIGDWRDLLPFFIHGNVAENCTLKMYKEMLVDQVVGNAKRILSEYPDINLRYECAFDDSSEGNQLLHIAIAPESTLREILKRVISKDPDMLEFVNSGRFIIPPLSQRYLDNHHDSPYSSCKLPAIIKQYYRETKTIK